MYLNTPEGGGETWFPQVPCYSYTLRTTRAPLAAVRGYVHPAGDRGRRHQGHTRSTEGGLRDPMALHALPRVTSMHSIVHSMRIMWVGIKAQCGRASAAHKARFDRGGPELGAALGRSSGAGDACSAPVWLTLGWAHPPHFRHRLDQHPMAADLRTNHAAQPVTQVHSIRLQLIVPTVAASGT